MAPRRGDAGRLARRTPGHTRRTVADVAPALTVVVHPLAFVFVAAPGRSTLPCSGYDVPPLVMDVIAPERASIVTCVLPSRDDTLATPTSLSLLPWLSASPLSSPLLL